VADLSRVIPDDMASNKYSPSISIGRFIRMLDWATHRYLILSHYATQYFRTINPHYHCILILTMSSVTLPQPPRLIGKDNRHLKSLASISANNIPSERRESVVRNSSTVILPSLRQLGCSRTALTSRAQTCPRGLSLSPPPDIYLYLHHRRMEGLCFSVRRSDTTRCSFCPLPSPVQA